MKNYLREIKRIICLFCTICLIVCITACNGTDQNGDNNGGLENKNPNWNSDDLEYNINIPNKIALYSAESVYQIIIETDFRYNTNDDAEFKTKQSKSRGSAFAINKEGYLMTCAHVICIDKEEYKTVEYVSRTVTAISFLSKYTFECDVIAYDEGYDLAVLKIKTDAINEDAKQYLQNNYLPFFKYKGSDSFSNYSNNNLWFGEYCYRLSERQILFNARNYYQLSYTLDDRRKLHRGNYNNAQCNYKPRKFGRRACKCLLCYYRDNKRKP